MKRAIVTVLMLAAAVGVAWTAGIGPFGKPAVAPEPPRLVEPPLVKLARPGRKTLHRRLTLPGDLRAHQQVTVLARVEGYVGSVAVDLGDRVKAGDVLARIEVPELEQEAVRLRADAGLAQAGVRRAEADRDLKRLIQRRTAEVAARSPDLVSQESVDEAKGQLDVAEAELAVARARLAAASARTAEAEVRLSFAVVRAPFDGTITQRWADPGTLLRAGEAGRIVALAAVRTLRLQVAVPESEAVWVVVGARATVRLAPLSGTPLEARVTRAGGALDPVSRTLKIECDVDNAEGRLRPGMYAEVSLDLDKHEEALVVPTEAIVMQGKKAFVYTVRDGRAERLPVRMGIEDGREVEILEGIGPQQEIIVEGRALVADGESVRVAPR